MFTVDKQRSEPHFKYLQATASFLTSSIREHHEIIPKLRLDRVPREQLNVFIGVLYTVSLELLKLVLSKRTVVIHRKRLQEDDEAEPAGLRRGGVGGHVGRSIAQARFGPNQAFVNFVAELRWVLGECASVVGAVQRFFELARHP